MQCAPHPTRLVFALLGALFVALTVVTVAALPETAAARLRRPCRTAAIGSGSAPGQARVRRRRSPLLVAAWALGGLILSVGGSLLAAVFDQPNHAVAGVVIGLFPLSAGSAVVLGRDVAPPAMTRIGCAALTAGTGLFLFAVGWSSIGLFVAASVVAGAGFGSGFLGSLRSVSQLAQAHQRAGLLSAVYVVS